MHPFTERGGMRPIPSSLLSKRAVTPSLRERGNANHTFSARKEVEEKRGGGRHTAPHQTTLLCEKGGREKEPPSPLSSREGVGGGLQRKEGSLSSTTQKEGSFLL